MSRPNMKKLVAVVNRGEKAFWTNIGVAFENRDGSWNLRFDFIPTDRMTTIQLRDFQARTDDAPDASVADEQPEGISASPF